MWQWGTLRDWLSGQITPYWTDPLLMAVQILIVIVCLILVMAFYTLAERKVIGWMQVRKGPNRVNLFWIPGLAQPFADVVKLMFKEIVIPADASGFLFRLAPFLSLVPSLAIWAVIPFRPGARLREHRCGPAVHPRPHLDGRVRDHPGRLGGQLQVRVPGRDALGGADRRL